MVDMEDADLGMYRWCVNSRYAARRSDNQTHFIHRIVLERKLCRPIQNGMVGDHINGDPLDNRRLNLREATPSQNARNSDLQKNNTCQYTGVSRSGRYYIARIAGNKKILGSFMTALNASFCYDLAALQLWGEFARLNHPLDEVLAWKAPAHFLYSTNTSGYRGVTVLKSGKWQVSLRDGDKVLHLGIFDTPEEAARAHDRKAIELRGEKAKLNFPGEDYEED